MTRRGTPEADLQRAVVSALRFALPRTAIIHHCANEVAEPGPRGAKRQAILVGMGVHAGFADLMVLCDGPRAVSGAEIPQGKTQPGAGGVSRCGAGAGPWLGAGAQSRRRAGRAGRSRIHDARGAADAARRTCPSRAEDRAMSHAATNWAIQQRGLKPTTKIVLWHLCDRFNPDYGCFPSQERLAHDCEIGRATLNRHLDDLEARGLIHRIRVIDVRTKRQRPTRYLLGFEPDFPPPGSRDPGGSDGAPSDQERPDFPCPDLRHGGSGENARGCNDLPPESPPEPCLDLGHGAVSHFETDPCLKNSESRVSFWDTNPVREPLSKPVKEEEDAAARDSDFDQFFAELLSRWALTQRHLPAWWQGWPARPMFAAGSTSWASPGTGSSRWPATQGASIPTRPTGPRRWTAPCSAPPSAMRRPPSGGSSRKSKRQRKRDTGPRPSDDELAAFYADLVNSDAVPACQHDQQRHVRRDAGAGAGDAGAGCASGGAVNGMVLRPRHGLSLCAGGGGLDLGLMLAEPGYHTRCFVEWEDWPRTVLIAAQRAGYFAPAPIWDDLRIIRRPSLPRGL